jgi:hypothetical protein
MNYAMQRAGRLHGCVGTDGRRPGRPVPVVHRFHTYGFRLFRGRGSFEAVDSDFPLNRS